MAERANGAASNAVMEDSLSEIEWARHKAAELAKLAERNAIVIVPIGSTEQHGPHLPTQVDARTDCIYTFISEFTVRHRVPLAGGTYWNIAQTEIAQILEKQKALLHACEAETSMMLALSPELIDRDGLSQVRGDLVPGLSAIPGVNAGVYRWRQLASRSLSGVIGEVGAASPEKGERLLQAIASAVAKALLEERLWQEPI